MKAAELREAAVRREKKLRRIGDRVHDRKWLPPTDGDYLLDEIERLEAVIRGANHSSPRRRGEHAEDCPMRYMYGGCTCGFSQEASRG